MPEKGQKILVTGSSGTIGTRLCELLMDKGHEVVGLDIKPNKWSDRVDKITVKADLLDPAAFDGLPDGIWTIVHLGAYALVYPLVVEPHKAMENMTMAFNALEYARKNGIGRFLFGSSREVYGNTAEIKHSEADAHVDNAESPYSATKLAVEAMVRAYQNCYGIDFIIIRFSNVYGMYDDSERLIPRSIRRARSGEELEVYGKEKTLDFTYIDDAVAGVMAAIEKFDAGKGETYNLATGSGTTIMEVVETINRLLGGKSRIKVTDPRAGEVIKYIADISKAKQRLGYEPKVSVQEGVKRSIDWYEKNAQ